jgi:hypothetical protein
VNPSNSVERNEAAVAEEYEALETATSFGKASPTAVFADPVRNDEMASFNFHTYPITVCDQGTAFHPKR